mmetsp:Transcript_13494/g.29313  ORF Transcript_13494/g.29313 Transcript_13494/m.29313 type:complete len:428 (+) Transcript_13494:216-1499(+)
MSPAHQCLRLHSLKCFAVTLIPLCGLLAFLSSGRKVSSSSPLFASQTSLEHACPAPFDYHPDLHRLRHYHQHKAGGKTVNYILERARPLSADTNDTTAGPLFTRDSGGEIHGSRKRLQKHIQKGDVTDRYVTFLREPTAKVMSRFYYHRTMCNGTRWLVPSYKLAGVCCLTLAQYVKERAMNNNQYESLVAGRPMGTICSPNNPSAVFENDWFRIRREMLTPDDICRGGWDGFVDRIQEILLDLSDTVFFGIVEKWDESLFLLSVDGGLDPSSVVYCHKNAKASGSPKPTELEEGLWGAEGKQTLRVLREYNALDLATYEAAMKLFNRKVACWEASRTVTVESEAERWQKDALAPFQEDNCGAGKKKSNRTYYAPVLGVPDGKLADPNFCIPSNLRIMISQEDGNKTCPELLEDFSYCEFTMYLEPC